VTATYVDTREVPLGALTRFPGNAKRGDVGKIRESVRASGQYRSLVVRDTGDQLIILAGNHTRDALAAEGYKTGRCEIITCDEQTARKINLADNRLAELGENDGDALAELLSYLDGDYDGTGYTQQDVDRLLDPPDIDTGGGDEPTGGMGEPVISYQLVFDNDVQQSAWFELVRGLKRQYGDLESLGERLHAWIGGLDLDDLRRRDF
jgi:hypothetical protein